MKKVLLLIVLITFCSTMGSAKSKERCTLNVASFNIRYDNKEDGINNWEHREEKATSLIRFHDFDVFGIQEGLIHQVRSIENMGIYDRVGVGRDDGKEAGEHMAVFYKKDSFKLLDAGNFWLSETQNVPSFGWDALCRRVCSWAKLKDLKSGTVFYFFSVHFDHRGKEARLKSAGLLLANIKKIAGSMPVILVGDFNGTIESDHIKIIKSDGILSDSRDISKTPPYGTEGTINQFQSDPKSKARIDYIFVTKNIQVNKYATLNESWYDKLPSDHYPILANITF